MGTGAQSWVNLKVRGRKRWRRLLTVMVVVLFVACLLRNQIISGDIYYAVDTVQYDYVTVDELAETVAPNWRGLQKKDVSFR
jgi:hypothetical protein